MKKMTNRTLNSRNKFIDFFIFILLFLVLVVLSFIAYRLTREGGQCIADPLAYGIKTFEKANNASVVCSCTVATKGDQLSFLYGSEGVIRKAYPEFYSFRNNS